MGRVKRIWCLSPMRAAKVLASLRIRAVSPEPPLLAHTSSESRGTFRQKARSLAPLNGWACAVKICHDGMLEDTNSLVGALIRIMLQFYLEVYIGLYFAKLPMENRIEMFRPNKRRDGETCVLRKLILKLAIFNLTWNIRIRLICNGPFTLKTHNNPLWHRSFR